MSALSVGYSAALRRHFFGAFVVQDIFCYAYPRVGRVVKFICSGGFCTAVHMGLLTGLVEFVGVMYYIANPVGFMVAFTIHFMLQKYSTFRDFAADERERRFQKVLFLIKSALLLALDTSLLTRLVEEF